MSEAVWALDPWSEELEFIPVPNPAPAVLQIPQPRAPPSPRYHRPVEEWVRTEHRAVTRRAYVLLGLHVWVFVANEDEARLRWHLGALARFLQLVMLAKGR